MNSILEYLLLFSIKSAIILCIALVFGKLTKHSSAKKRSFIWTSTIYIILLLPIVQFFTPVYNLELIDKVHNISTIQPSSDTQEVRERTDPTSNRTPYIFKESLTNSEASYTSVKTFISSLSTSELVLYGWLSISFFVYCRLFIGLISVWWMAKRAENVTNKEWNLLAIDLGNELGLKRTVKLLISNNSTTPMTWGIFQPFILLPKKSENWSLERLKLVLIHEMAHVKRKDFVTHIVAQFVSAILWFNPMVWIITKELISDREHACDDHVLNGKNKASDYATHLLEIAKSLKESHGSTFATLCMAKNSQLEGRLLSILDDEKEHSVYSKKTSVLSYALILLIVVPLSALQPWKTTDKSDTVFRKPILKEIPTRIVAEPEPPIENVEEQNIISSIVNKEIVSFVESDEFEDAVTNMTSSIEIDVSNVIVNLLTTPLDSLSIKDLIRMKKYGVLPEFIAKLNQYGLNELSVDDVISFAKYGVTTEFIDDLNEEGFKNISTDNLISSSKYGVTSEYINEMKKAGYEGNDLKLLSSMSKYGVTPEFVKAIKEAGYRKFEWNDVVSASKYGVKTDLIRSLNEMGYHSISLKDITNCSKYGVDKRFLKGLNESSLKNASIDEIINMSKYGASPSKLKEYSDLGYKNIDADELIKASKYGLSTSLVKEVKQAGFKSVTFSELIDIAKYGADSKLIRKLNNAGFNDLSAKDITNVAKYGIDFSYRETLKTHKIDHSLYDLIKLSKYGGTRHHFDILYKFNYKNPTVKNLINVAKYDLDESLLQGLTRHSYTNVEIEDLIALSKYGVDEDYISEIHDSGYTDLTIDDLIKMKKQE